MINQNPEPAERILDALAGVARFLLYVGLAAALVGAGFLVFTAMSAGGAASQNLQQAQQNIDIFGKALLFGVIGIAIGSSFLFWGEEILGALQLLGAALLYFSPLYLPLMGVKADQDVAQAAMAPIRDAGLILGVVGLLVLLIDITGKVRGRLQQGIKADQLKYGKGVREERDIQNVFLGKCWQLPYCRKFVRERCPIYHSKRTCWRELTGCMCEEKVIANAMENKPIPKDAVLAAQFIPRNDRLTLSQKRERCKVCVIYNEHQKHKYRAVLPAVIVGFIAFYALFRGPLLAGTTGLVEGIDRMIGRATFNQVGGRGGTGIANNMFIEVLLICMMFVALTYALKVVEYLIFKLKI